MVSQKISSSAVMMMMQALLVVHRNCIGGPELSERSLPSEVTLIPLLFIYHMYLLIVHLHITRIKLFLVCRSTYPRDGHV